MAVTWHQLVNNNRGIVFSAQSVPRCYKQDQLAVAVRDKGYKHIHKRQTHPLLRENVT
jgi:hypothetical protein